ncbi:hypothetical protein ACWKYF_17435 [Enterobacter asburiae]
MADASEDFLKDVAIIGTNNKHKCLFYMNYFSKRNINAPKHAPYNTNAVGAIK